MMLLCLLIEKLTTQSLLLVAVMDKLCTCVHPAEISQQLSCNMCTASKGKVLHCSANMWFVYKA